MQNVLNSVKSFCESINHNPCPNEKSPFKESHGEVYTPLEVIYHMLAQLPEHILKDPYIKYLDSGAGLGNFSLVLYFLLKSQNISENHILSNMIHIVEINSVNTAKIETMINSIYSSVNENSCPKSMSSNTLNVSTNISNISYTIDFLSENKYLMPKTFDVIYGNPPYNVSGKIKTPTNNTHVKTNDGINAWVPFVRRAYDLLKPNGILLYIIPSIWCKPDKAKIYELFTQYFQINYLEFYSNTETNKIFSSQAQTPTVIIMATKLEYPNNTWAKQNIPIYDSINKHIVTFTLRNEKAIPTKGLRIIEKFQSLITSYDSLMPFITKTSMPPLHTTLIHKETITHSNKNIHSAIIANKSSHPKQVELVIKYSNTPLAYMNKKKIVMPHKMFGLPYYDICGNFGISNRDNYVFILPEILDEFYTHYQLFLNTKLIQFLLSCSRYRMMVIEKHIFDYIPQIHKMIKINRYNPIYANYYNRKDMRQNTNRIAEIEVNILMNTFSKMLTKEEENYIENNFHNYSFITTNKMDNSERNFVERNNY